MREHRVVGVPGTIDQIAQPISATTVWCSMDWNVQLSERVRCKSPGARAFRLSFLRETGWGCMQYDSG